MPRDTTEHARPGGPRPSRLVTALVGLLLLAASIFAARLHTTDSHDTAALEQAVLPELRFLDDALAGGAAGEMQRLFPEGYFFSYVLQGLAWAELGLAQPRGAASRQEALDKARVTLVELDSQAARAVFSRSLAPPYGVFYAGWRAWLRGVVIELAEEGSEDARRTLDAECAEIAAAFDASPTPFLESYPGQAWPSDSVVALAALSLRDHLGPPRHAATIARVLQLARARLDPAAGLLPHRVHPGDGRQLEGARASSQSVITRFLVDVDPAWAGEQYLRFRDRFLVTRLGLPAIAEYPHGEGGQGDVDSGPLVWGVSASATVVTLGAARVNGDHTTADALSGVMEAFGLPLTIDGKKRYGFGLLPVGDAFIAWSKAARPHLGHAPAPGPAPPSLSGWFRAPPLLAAALLAAWLAWRLARHRAGRIRRVT